MRIYLAAPLFTTAERSFNVDLATALRAAGHAVFLPQDQDPTNDAAAIFRTDFEALEAADAVVAVMDGADPDSGTCWECGYAYRRKPIVLVRTDIRSTANERVRSFNPMLTESADATIELALGTPAAVGAAILEALAAFPAGRGDR